MEPLSHLQGLPRGPSANKVSEARTATGPPAGYPAVLRVSCTCMRLSLRRRRQFVSTHGVSTQLVRARPALGTGAVAALGRQGRGHARCAKVPWRPARPAVEGEPRTRAQEPKSQEPRAAREARTAHAAAPTDCTICSPRAQEPKTIQHDPRRRSSAIDTVMM